MKTVTFDVRSPQSAMAEALAAAKFGKPQKSARPSFAAPGLLWRVLTAKRWALLKKAFEKVKPKNHGHRMDPSRREPAISKF